MKIAFFGSSLVSTYWNGAATYYRGIVRALHNIGHRITFYEPDAYDRQNNRDIPDPNWARVVVYEATEAAACLAVKEAARADLIVKASGVGVLDDLLEHEVLYRKTSSNIVAFWDVDAPATLERIEANPADPFRFLIPDYDVIFTYGGGKPVVQEYLRNGARQCVPVYNALDPSTHFPVEPDDRFRADIAFLGNRLPDREARVEEFFLKPAVAHRELSFLLGGAGWGDKARTPNVHYVGHVRTADHNAFNCTPRTVLNISRDSMARYGFSPATRVFEAAGAGACVITDAWAGIEEFFEPGSEILVAAGGGDVVELVRRLSESDARAIGKTALRRALRQHTYRQRARLVESVLDGAAMNVSGAGL
jgi:spore maturation protein CgeB